MAFEDEAPLERAYPYHASWKSLACAILFLAAIGTLGAGLVPFGCALRRDGQQVLGSVVATFGVCVGVMLPFSLLLVVFGVKQAIFPDLVRVTPASLVLPDSLRGIDNSQADEKEPPKPAQQPEEIPFSAIRWVRRETTPSPGSDTLVIVHDLSGFTLELKQYMMRPEDFDELETVLRAAIPAAFTAAPPVPPSPPPADDV
jgi:hypothetical protein